MWPLSDFPEYNRSVPIVIFSIGGKYNPAPVSVRIEMDIRAPAFHPAGRRTACEFCQVSKQRHAPYRLVLNLLFAHDQLQIVRYDLDPGIAITKQLEVAIRDHSAARMELAKFRG